MITFLAFHIFFYNKRVYLLYKIPTTAVVMPGGSVPQLDVNCEFGFWDASGDSAFVSGSSLKLHSGYVMG